MPRFFNTAGPCRPERHFMLPPERRLPEIPELIGRGEYLLLCSPPKAGKTTFSLELARALPTAEWAAVATQCSVGRKQDEPEQGVLELIATLRRDAEEQLSSNLLPPFMKDAGPTVRLMGFLTEWARSCPRPLVLFLDGIDELPDHTRLTVLAQLRSGFSRRFQGGFPRSVVLLAAQDVRFGSLDPQESFRDYVPFNVVSRRQSLPSFTLDEVAGLYAQHTEETGQTFSPEATVLAWELTRGQPWLVNALAAEIVKKLVPDRSVRIEARHVERAKEILIERRDAHLDSLADRLREPRVRRILEPIFAGQFLAPDVLEEDVQFVKDLGLVTAGPAGLEIANPIYREVIPRALGERGRARRADDSTRTLVTGPGARG
jgi:hypothetical protein